MAILVLLSWRFSPSIPRPLLCLPVLWYSSKTLNIHTRIMCVCVVFKYACACVIYFILCIEWLICNINLFCADPFYCMLKNCCFLCVMFVYVWACRFCGVSHLKHEPFCAYTFWLLAEKLFTFSSLKQMVGGSRYYAQILLLKSIFSVEILGCWMEAKFEWAMALVLMMFLFWYFRPLMCWKQRKVILLLLQSTQVGMILCALSAMVAASKFLL